MCERCAILIADISEKVDHLKFSDQVRYVANEINKLMNEFDQTDKALIERLDADDSTVEELMEKAQPILHLLNRLGGLSSIIHGMGFDKTAKLRNVLGQSGIDVEIRVTPGMSFGSHLDEQAEPKDHWERLMGKR